MCDRGELLAVVVLCVSRLMSLIAYVCVCARTYVCVQLGGTVGDIESMPFIEAFRQFQFKVKRENFCNIHVSLIPQVRRAPPSGWFLPDLPG